MKKFNPEIFEDHNHKKLTRIYLWAWVSSVVSIIAVTALLMCLSTPAYAYGPYRGLTKDVIDGDTIKADIAIFPGLIHRANIRLSGIDAPEMRGDTECEKQLAQASKQFLEQLLIPTAGQIIVKNVKQGKYAGRIVADVYVRNDLLGDKLINAGHAVEYHGGKRKAWCRQ